MAVRPSVISFYTLILINPFHFTLWCSVEELQNFRFRCSDSWIKQPNVNQSLSINVLLSLRFSLMITYLFYSSSFQALWTASVLDSSLLCWDKISRAYEHILLSLRSQFHEKYVERIGRDNVVLISAVALKQTAHETSKINESCFNPTWTEGVICVRTSGQALQDSDSEVVTILGILTESDVKLTQSSHATNWETGKFPEDARRLWRQLIFLC